MDRMDGKGVRAPAVSVRDARGIGALLRDLAGGSAQLVRSEMRLARIELTGTVRALGSGTAQVAVGATLALIGTLALIAGVILLAGDQWLRDRYWLAALIVGVVLLALAAWAGMRGKNLLSPTRLVPDETIATLKEDSEWLKRPLTSDATSS
jgi:uncharacterized membrane protein YqjE